MQGDAANDHVAIHVVDGTDRRLVGAAQKLGDEFRKTVGLLPYSVFDDAAADGCLLAALAGNQLVGYALYRTPRNEIALTQLCVATDWRRRGISDRLVEAVSARHADRLGIKVKCRVDYNLDHVWIRLGFVKRAEVRGRGKHELPLGVWWRDHGHPDLFTELDEPSYVIRVAIDINVIRDLSESETRRDGSEESRVLVRDDIADLIELVVVPGVHDEFDRAKDPQRVAAMRAETARYRMLRPSQQEVENAEQSMLKAIRSNVPGFGKSAQDKADLRAIAQAGCGGADVFATKDEKLLKAAAVPAMAELGIQVLHPVNVLLRLDQIQQAAAYQPARLVGTSYEIRIAGPKAERELGELADTSGGESPQGLVRRTRAIVAAGGRWKIVHNQSGDAVAAFAAVEREDRTDIEFLRVRDDSLSLTLSRQILSILMRECHAAGGTELRLVDERVPRLIEHAADYEGFQRTPLGRSRIVIDVAGSAHEVHAAASVVAQRIGLRDLPPLMPNMSPQAAARVEKQIWPAKIVDSNLPSYIVPIRPRWASDLFGEPASLLARPSELGISLEHVYYRSARQRIHAPARILWYRSDEVVRSFGRPRRSSGVLFAASLLEEVVEDSPENLHRWFAHLGVYSLEDIQKAAGPRGLAQALRFSTTEMFRNKLPLAQVRAIGSRHGRTLITPSPQLVTSNIFHDLWRGAHG